jgi:hypothetical protein
MSSRSRSRPATKRVPLTSTAAAPAPSDNLTAGAASWAAAAGAVVVLAYSVVVVVAMVTGGYPPSGPYQEVAATLALIAAPVLVVLAAALHQSAPANRKALSLSALALMVLFAAATGTGRFLQLTYTSASLTIGRADLAAAFLPSTWPSVTMALDALGSGYFLGLALLFSAPLFGGSRLETTLRWWLITSGAVCLAGGIGLWLGFPEMLPVGFIGWGPLFAVGLVLMGQALRVRARQRG